MTTLELGLYLLFLILPVAYQRGKLKKNPALFLNTPLRDNSGLNIHHGHFGVVLAFLAMNIQMFGYHNWFSCALNGLGWGLMLDEIIPMLDMPSPGRDVEMDTYKSTTKRTVVLIGAVCVLTFGIFLIFGRK